MRLIRDIHRERQAAGKPVVSFEFFPPKTDEGDRALFEKTLPALMTVKPDFCSVTYGAGGGTRDKTLGVVDRIQREFQLPTMSHLTCVNSTQDQIASVLQEARQRGISNILALRGDPPPGTGDFRKTEGGFEYSYELVRFIRQFGGFGIGTAGFPEGHIACKEGKQTDWKHLKAKIDEGADFVITQLFFDNRDYLEFRDFLNRHGSNVPIFPGIIPVLSASQIKKFTALCGARIPDAMSAQLDALKDDDAGAAEFGIDYATRQCQELLREGVPGVHFYTLNKAASTVRVIQNLNLS